MQNSTLISTLREFTTQSSKSQEKLWKKPFFLDFRLPCSHFKVILWLCFSGEMAEWSKATVSKIVVGATSPRVQIPLSPPFFSQKMAEWSRQALLHGTQCRFIHRKMRFIFCGIAAKCFIKNAWRWSSSISFYYEAFSVSLQIWSIRFAHMM